MSRQKSRMFGLAIVVASLGIWVAAIQAGGAPQKGQGKPAPAPTLPALTALFSGPAYSTGVPDGMRIYGDGDSSALYGTGSDQSSAEIDSIHYPIHFFTWSSATRLARRYGYVDFSGLPNDALGQQFVYMDAHFLSIYDSGDLVPVDANLLNFHLGQTAYRWGYINFFLTSGGAGGDMGQQYQLKWGTKTDFPIVVTCTAVTGTSCSQWEVSPTEAALLRKVVAINHNVATWADVGTFNMPFKLTFTVR